MTKTFRQNSFSAKAGKTTLAKQPSAKGKIDKSMTLGEVVARFPDAVPVMLDYGLHCVGCHVAAWETVEQGAKAHGMGEKEINEMLQKMNSAVSEGKK